MHTTNVLKPELVDCLRKELNNYYYFKYEGGGGRRKVAEEKRGRRYKEGYQMVQRGFFWAEHWEEENFYRRRE